MDHFIIDVIGYAAAVITNISVYPQAFKVNKILTNQNYEKLNSISLPMYILQSFGCVLWLIYAIVTNLYPVMFGSVMCLLPSCYIIIILVCNQNKNVVMNEFVATEQINQIRSIIEEIDMTETRNDPYNEKQDDTTIVIASGCSFQETSTGEL